MVIGVVRGIVRGGIAWLMGYVLMAVLVLAGVAGGAGGMLGGAARAYLGAHAVPPGSIDPAYLSAVPVLVLALAGYRAGRALKTGIVGRLRSFVQSFRRTERKRALQAVTTAAVLVGGYALIAAVVALLVGTSVQSAVVGSLIYGLVVGVPAAIVGAVQ